MPDYKEMYVVLFRASEQAINILIDAQQACEELYVADTDPVLKALAPSVKNEKSVDKA